MVQFFASQCKFNISSCLSTHKKVSIVRKCRWFNCSVICILLWWMVHYCTDSLLTTLRPPSYASSLFLLFCQNVTKFHTHGDYNAHMPQKAALRHVASVSAARRDVCSATLPCI